MRIAARQSLRKFQGDLLSRHGSQRHIERSQCDIRGVVIRLAAHSYSVRKVVTAVVVHDELNLGHCAGCTGSIIAHESESGSVFPLALSSESFNSLVAEMLAFRGEIGGIIQRHAWNELSHPQ